jgi:hypothetical protein
LFSASLNILSLAFFIVTGGKATLVNDSSQETDTIDKEGTVAISIDRVATRRARR